MLMGSVPCFLMFAEYARVKGWKKCSGTIPYTQPPSAATTLAQVQPDVARSHVRTDPTRTPSVCKQAQTAELPSALQPWAATQDQPGTLYPSSRGLLKQRSDLAFSHNRY